MAEHILLVDDDNLLRDSLSFSLEQSGYRVSAAASAEEGLTIAHRDSPDLVLLDIALPGMDGLQALRHFEAFTEAPVIFLTARRRDLDEVFGLELGAADYVTKPFATNVLLARIKATLRQSRRADLGRLPETMSLKVDDLFIDPDAHTVTVSGQPVHLSPREFDLLYVLAQEAGRVVRLEDLIARVWGSEYEGESQVVYVQICWLREKLEEDPRNPRRILTVRGIGYKLEPQEQNR
jgi:DNA-binding response OmpR family regulator